jgi:predicted chitinase
MNQYEVSILNELHKLNYSHDLMASVLAQVKVESGNYKIFRENLNYTNVNRLYNMFKGRFKNIEEAGKYLRSPEKLANFVYNRKELGNTTFGDGWKYRGNGLPQLTGKDMHKLVGDMIGIDLVNNPELLGNDIDINAKAVVAFCDIKNIKKCSTIEEVSKKWNGGSNGLYERQKEFLDERFELFVTEDLNKRTQDFNEYLMRF